MLLLIKMLVYIILLIPLNIIIIITHYNINTMQCYKCTINAMKIKIASHNII